MKTLKIGFSLTLLQNKKKRFVERENVLFAGRENKRENSALLEEEEEKNIRYDKIT